MSAVRRYDVVEEVTEAAAAAAATAVFDKFELVELEAEVLPAAAEAFPVRLLGTSPTMECMETIELEFEFNALWYFDLV